VIFLDSRSSAFLDLGLLDRIMFAWLLFEIADLSELPVIEFYYAVLSYDSCL